MGDRGNIVVRGSETARDDVWLYTHWSGHAIKETARKALAKKERWTDAQYLARIVFDELTCREEGTTGFGITARMGDNEYPICLVDVPRQMVVSVPAHNVTDDGILSDDLSELGGKSFAEFVEAKPEPVPA